jgi:hypothetical protein
MVGDLRSAHGEGTSKSCGYVGGIRLARADPGLTPNKTIDSVPPPLWPTRTIVSNNQSTLRALRSQRYFPRVLKMRSSGLIAPAPARRP